METSNRPYLYDVAFSFLSQDVALAEQLGDTLAKELSVFVFTRNKEELLGQDGMDRFAAVFGKDTRLAVVLYRAGWGETPWTAFEESHIKDRALVTHMTSFMIVRLDDAELRQWVPATHIYASTAIETTEQIVGVIRILARQQGAVLRRESAAEHVLNQKRAADAAQQRAVKAASKEACKEVHECLTALFEEITRIIEEIKQGDPSIRVIAKRQGSALGLEGPQISTSLEWHQPSINSLQSAALYVKELTSQGAYVLAKSQGYYVPELSSENKWVWVYQPSNDGGMFFLNLRKSHYSTMELADHIVRQHFKRAAP